MKRIAILALAACMLAPAGCLSIPWSGDPGYARAEAGSRAETAQSNLHLNGTAYVAALSINGLPFQGALARRDASTGWRFQIRGKQVETADLAGVPVDRAWEISFDLSKKGLTMDPNGLYTGKASISLRYDMGPFDQEAFKLVMEERGNGTDFDYQRIKGWFSHDEYKASRLDQLWESTDFTLYIGGLEGNRTSMAKTLGHTLSYLPQRPSLRFVHRLYYDLPEDGETYVYILEGSESEQAALLRLAEYKGTPGKSLPPEPVARFDLSDALSALDEAYILLELWV